MSVAYIHTTYNNIGYIVCVADKGILVYLYIPVWISIYLIYAYIIHIIQTVDRMYSNQLVLKSGIRLGRGGQWLIGTRSTKLPGL